jgi:hypothetical protein
MEFIYGILPNNNSKQWVIDINLDKVTASGTQQLGTNETIGDIEEETGTVTNNEGSEGDD